MKLSLKAKITSTADFKRGLETPEALEELKQALQSPDTKATGLSRMQTSNSGVLTFIDLVGGPVHYRIKCNPIWRSDLYDKFETNSEWTKQRILKGIEKGLISTWDIYTQ